jgi:hypothetical protein
LIRNALASGHPGHDRARGRRAAIRPANPSPSTASRSRCTPSWARPRHRLPPERPRHSCYIAGQRQFDGPSACMVVRWCAWLLPSEV